MVHYLHPSVIRDNLWRGNCHNQGIQGEEIIYHLFLPDIDSVVAAFGSIVANTFMATYTESGAVDKVASAANATTAMISILFIIIAIAFGFLVYRRNAGLGVSTVSVLWQLLPAW